MSSGTRANKQGDTLTIVRHTLLSDGGETHTNEEGEGEFAEKAAAAEEEKQVDELAMEAAGEAERGEVGSADLDDDDEVVVVVVVVEREAAGEGENEQDGRVDDEIDVKSFEEAKGTEEKEE